MEQAKKQSKLMVIMLIILTIVTIIAIIEGIVIITSKDNNNNNGELKSEDCIGTWKISDWTNEDISIYYMPTIEIYKGGTAKGSDRKDEKTYHPFNWEIKDNMLVLTESSSVFGTGTSTSYEIKGNIMTSADGTLSFKRISK